MTMTFEILSEKAAPLLKLMAERRNGGAFADSPFETFYVLEKGRKYNRIVQDTRNKETGEVFNQRSCSGFIDNEGNIYKSAGWKAPAKHARGHIDNCEKSIGPDGFILYLR